MDEFFLNSWHLGLAKKPEVIFMPK